MGRVGVKPAEGAEEPGRGAIEVGASGRAGLEPPRSGRIAGGELGRTEGELGRTLPPELEPRPGLGATEGREEPPPDGRGAALEPREPWLEEGFEIDPPPPDPLPPWLADEDDPLEPFCGSAGEAGAKAISASPTSRAERVFMGGLRPGWTQGARKCDARGWTVS